MHPFPSSSRLRPVAPRAAPRALLPFALAVALALPAFLAPHGALAAGPDDRPHSEPLPPLDLTAIATAVPPGAREVALSLQLRERTHDPKTAIVLSPRQVVTMTLVAADGAARRMVPPLRNSPDGAGPGEALALRDERVQWRWSAGSGIELAGRTLTWRAPAAGGRYVIDVILHDTERLGGAIDDRLAERWGRAEFNVFVLEPFDPSTFVLQGVAIGVYPDPAAPDVPAVVAQNVERYRAPRAFLKVTPDVRRLELAAGFTIGDFAMDERRFGDRQYIVVDPALLARLERLRELVRARGWGGPAARIAILRGYVSPLAAEALRREGASISTFSRFIYGDAAIIIVDGDGDGRMDDLNHDGKVDGRDAAALAELVEQVEADLGFGGIGVYGRPPDATLPDTPFVHLDARGSRARWEFGME